MSKSEQFWQACTDGNLELVKELGGDPETDVNWKDPEVQRTGFLRSCFLGHVAHVEFLLKHPRVDVNTVQAQGTTPFFLACQEGHAEIVSMLLADPRIDINLPSVDQSTPLWFASQNGHLDVVQRILGCGRDVDTERKTVAGNAGWNNTTAAEWAAVVWKRREPSPTESLTMFNRRQKNCPAIAELITSFRANPDKVRQLQQLRGVREPLIGEVFAMVILLSDHFVTFKEKKEDSQEEEKEEKDHNNYENTRRFLEIASRFPMDLQMVLCNRLFSSPKDIILSKFSEPGFKKLARADLWII
jgi:hypothetical protein